MVSITAGTCTGFSSSTEVWNYKKAAWRRCCSSLVVENEQKFFRWWVSWMEGKRSAGGKDWCSVGWTGAGEVGKARCVRIYKELSRKKDQPEGFKAPPYLFLHSCTSFFSKSSSDLLLCNQPWQNLVEEHSFSFMPVSWYCGQGFRKGTVRIAWVFPMTELEPLRVE